MEELVLYLHLQINAIDYLIISLSPSPDRCARLVWKWRLPPYQDFHSNCPEWGVLIRGNEIKGIRQPWWRVSAFLYFLRNSAIKHGRHLSSLTLVAPFAVVTQPTTLRVCTSTQAPLGASERIQSGSWESLGPACRRPWGLVFEGLEGLLFGAKRGHLLKDLIVSRLLSKAYGESFSQTAENVNCWTSTSCPNQR